MIARAIQAVGWADDAARDEDGGKSIRIYGGLPDE
jgi:hypothetical protein